MDDGIFTFLKDCRNGFHKALAGVGAVAGIYIDVLAPETAGAVVGVAGAVNRAAAHGTGKVFSLFLE